MLEDCLRVGPETEPHSRILETVEARRRRLRERGELEPREPHENDPLIEARRKQIVGLVAHMARERMRRN